MSSSIPQDQLKSLLVASAEGESHCRDESVFTDRAPSLPTAKEAAYAPYSNFR
jgi:hypothetical protein